MEIRSLKILTAARDYLITGVTAGRVLEKPEGERLNRIRLDTGGDAYVHLNADVAHAASVANRFVAEVDGRFVSAPHERSWGTPEVGSVVPLFCVIRKPRFERFLGSAGAPQATFVLHGARDADAAARTALSHVGFLADGKALLWSRIALGAFMLASFILLFWAGATVAGDSFISAVGAAQFAFLGVAAAVLAKTPLAVLLAQAPALSVPLRGGAALAAAFVVGAILVVVYQQFGIFLDTAGYFIEEFGGRVEAFARTVRSSWISFFTWASAGGAPAEARLGAIAVFLCRAAVFAGAFGVAAGASAFLTGEVERRKIAHDVSLLIWAGGGPVFIRSAQGQSAARLSDAISAAELDVDAYDPRPATSFLSS